MTLKIGGGRKRLWGGHRQKSRGGSLAVGTYLQRGSAPPGVGPTISVVFSHFVWGNILMSISFFSSIASLEYVFCAFFVSCIISIKMYNELNICISIYFRFKQSISDYLNLNPHMTIVIILMVFRCVLGLD